MEAGLQRQSNHCGKEAGKPRVRRLKIATNCGVKSTKYEALNIVQGIELERSLVTISGWCYAKTSASEAPLYHQKNVVAYPQDVDHALKTLGMDPRTLSKTVLVQFVGEGRQALHQEKDLRVSVLNLRRAFKWLSENCWPFMETTKDHQLWESGFLDPSIEDLLRAYEVSVGSASGGVPAELIQAATNIPASRISVHAAGHNN